MSAVIDLFPEQQVVGLSSLVDLQPLEHLEGFSLSQSTNVSCSLQFEVFVSHWVIVLQLVKGDRALGEEFA